MSEAADSRARKRLLGASAIMASGTMVSRILGFVRTLLGLDTQFLERNNVDVRDDEVRTDARECACDLKADAGTGAGDETDFSIKSTHLFLLC